MNSLNKLESAVHNCDRCRLGSLAANHIFGEGDPNAAVMIVGESPGKEDSSSGRLFKGDAGVLLDKAFVKLSVDRGDFYLANILKCHSRGGRMSTDIKQECIPECFPFLEEQIGIIKPKSILALGAASMQTLIDSHSSIGKVRGMAFAGPNEALVVPTWHPSYILRCGGRGGSKQKQRQAAREFMDDFKCALTLAEVTWEEKK